MFSQIYLIMEEKKKRKKLNKYRYFSTGLKNRDDFIRVCYIFRQMFKLSQSILSRCLFKDRTKSRVNRIPDTFFPDFLNRCHEFARKSNDRFTKESKWNSALRDTVICIHMCVCVWVCMTFVIDTNCKHEWQICIFRINMTKFLLDRLYVNQRFFRYWTQISRHRFLCTRICIKNNPKFLMPTC